MKNKTLDQKKAEFVDLANKNEITVVNSDETPIAFSSDIKWRSHKEADEAIEKLNEVVLAKLANKEAKTKTVKENKMNTPEAAVTLKDLQNIYNEKFASISGNIGEFKEVKFRTKAAAVQAIADIDAYIESLAVNKGDTKKDKKSKKQTKEETTMAKEEKAGKKGKKEKAAKTAPVNDSGELIKINRVQWVILNLFKKQEYTQKKLQEAYIKATGKEKATIVPAQVGMMAKMDLVEVYEEDGEKVIEITALGREAASQPEPKVAEPKPAKPKYEPLYTAEDIAGMKKKKAAKAQAEQDAHMEAWIAEHGPIGRKAGKVTNPSTYNNTVPCGRWQRSIKGDATSEERPGASMAVRDLFDLICFNKKSQTPRMSRIEFVDIAHNEHGINKGNINTNLNGYLKEEFDLPKDFWSNVTPGKVEDDDQAEPAPGKKGKKGKKSKKA